MTISYRTRRTFQNIGIGLVILVLVAILVWMIWLLWLDRYVIYTRDGARLDFSLSVEHLSGEEALPDIQEETISIYYNEGGNMMNTNTELTQLTGYYADVAMLEKEFDLVCQQIYQLPAETPVMIDVKDISGKFLYTTSVGAYTSKTVDIAKMDELLAYLRNSGMYVIARIPAFRDYHYGLDHVPYGLHHSSNRYLYMDKQNCYWLDPQSNGTYEYLVQIVTELKNMGFDEVVFSDFRYPDTDQLAFKGDRDAALAAAAEKLVSACGSDTFAISFTVEKPSFPLPAGRTRLYLADRSASEAHTLAEQATVPDKAIQLVFIADGNDTRFDAYSVLRPVTAARLDEE